jgi:hypothetical protein
MPSATICGGCTFGENALPLSLSVVVTTSKLIIHICGRFLSLLINFRRTNSRSLTTLTSSAPSNLSAQKLVFCNSDLDKLIAVRKVGDLEGKPKPFWIWKHIHIHKVHVYEAYAYELHAHEVYACEKHVHDMHVREVHARKVHTREMYAHELQNHAPHLEFILVHVSHHPSLVRAACSQRPNLLW